MKANNFKFMYYQGLYHCDFRMEKCLAKVSIIGYWILHLIIITYSVTIKSWKDRKQCNFNCENYENRAIEIRKRSYEYSATPL